MFEKLDGLLIRVVVVVVELAFVETVVRRFGSDVVSPLSFFVVTFAFETA